MSGPGPSSTVISALERTWAEIRDRHPDVPEAVITTGVGQHGPETTLGSWQDEVWRTVPGAASLPHLFIAGECFAQGVDKVLETLLHEAAHGVATAREIKDTSRGYRYHNKRFVQLAEELGLEGPEAPHPVRGWYQCDITEATASGYESRKALADAIVVFIDPAVPDEEPDKEKSRAPVYECSCEPARKVRIGKKAYEEGPLLCGNCEDPFLEVLE